MTRLEPYSSVSPFIPLLDSLTAGLTLGYLDDVTLGDQRSIVIADIHRIKEVGESLGLSLNINKCELICHHDI